MLRDGELTVISKLIWDFWIGKERRGGVTST